MPPRPSTRTRMPKLTSVEVTTSTSVMEILGVTVSMVAAMAMGTGLLAGMLLMKSPTTTPVNRVSTSTFTFYALEQSVSALTVAEVQKNVPGLETVFVRANANTLKILNQNGTDIFTPVSIGNSVLQPPAVGDIDGDGEAEIIITPQTSSRILAFNHDGTPVSGWPITIDQGAAKNLQLVDVNADGTLDVVYITKNNVHMVNGSGQEIRAFSTADGLSGTTTTTKMDIQDVTGDSQVEIITTTQASAIPYDILHTAIYSLSGQKSTSWNTDGQARELYAVDLLQSSPGKEIIIPASLFNKQTSETTYKIYAFASSGAPLSGWPISTNVDEMAIGNVLQQIQTGTDNLEIVAIVNGQVTMFQSDGTVAPGWPVSPTSTCAPGNVLLNDVNGDLSPEIVVTTNSSTQTNCQVAILNADGQHTSGSPYATNASITGYRPPVVADFDVDGKPEILVPATNTSYIFRWDGEIATSVRSAQWPHVKQNQTLRPTIPTLCLPTADGSTADPACVGMCADGSPNQACNVDTSCTDGTTRTNGDVDGDNLVTITDAVYLINYIFAGGSVPTPLSQGDVDASGEVSITDAVYLINYIFAGGSAPKCPTGSTSVKRAVNPTQGMTYEQFKGKYPQVFTATQQTTEQL
ncbi:MAG: FG-GAP-like repeat-containing protein [Patescibacteria group bacterium]